MCARTGTYCPARGRHRLTSDRRTRRLIADEENRRALVRKKALQMMQHASAGAHATRRDDDGWLARPVDALESSAVCEYVASLHIAAHSAPDKAWSPTCAQKTSVASIAIGLSIYGQCGMRFSARSLLSRNNKCCARPTANAGTTTTPRRWIVSTTTRTSASKCLVPRS